MDNLLKVCILPQFGEQEKGEGGIRRVVEAQRKHLPSVGVKIVDTPEEADVVNTHGTEHSDYPVRTVSCHGLYWSGWEWGNWAYEANKRVIRECLRAQSVTSPSRWVANALQRGMLIDPVFCPHGVNLEDWDPQTPGGYVLWAKNRKDPICDPAPVNLLASRVPQVPFITTLGQSATNVAVTGPLTHENTKTLIQRASVYLGTVCETGGITVLEAMAAGVPVVGWSWGVNPELIVHGETGFLVEPDDYDGLAEGVHYCLENRDRLSAAARAWVRDNRQWKDVIHFHRLAYERALAEARREGPLVSIVVTAFKLEAYLPACIESILAQTMTDWELIVVDDASPDRCGEIADGYASRDQRIRVIHNPSNQYLAEARNVGFRSAGGKFFMALDADDQLPPDALAILSGALHKGPDLDIVTGSMELIEDDGRRWVSPGWPSKTPSYHWQVRKQNQVPYSSLYRRWLWDRTGGYRRRYRTVEDAEFWLRTMSFGATPARVTDKVTLIYSNRASSMSHTITAPDWTAWCSWAHFAGNAPYPASEDGREINNYNPPLTTVVIPCGPGHDIYLQDALDSLIAQTMTDWEVVVVNDTGQKWLDDAGRVMNPYLAGYPFVRIVDGDAKTGPAGARNRGIREVRTETFVLLDADDFFQPLALEVLYKAYLVRGGWIYSDWLDQDGQIKESRDYDFDELLVKMIGPSTGLYRTRDWEHAGGFDEKMPTWEDFEFQINLAGHGVCGTRVAYPLFTYRYHTGTVREEGYKHAAKLLAYVKKKHAVLYDGRCYDPFPD